MCIRDRLNFLPLKVVARNLKLSLGADKEVSILATARFPCCLLYTSDAADERSSVDLGGRRIIKKKNTTNHDCGALFIKKIALYT